MHKTAQELAVMVGGTLEGDPVLLISGVAGLREAEPGQVAFLEHPRYASLLPETRASLVLVAPGVAVPPKLNVIRVAHPSVAFGRIVALISPPPITYPPGIHLRALVDPAAHVAEGCSIGPFAVLEAGATVGARTVIGAGCYVGHEARLGEDCLLHPNVSVRDRCVLGHRVILHCGAVIGSDGFGYDFVENRYRKIPQVGFVQLDDDVEIGANATVDRGRFGRTWIKQGVKIDNLVQIAHNVIVGEHTVIVAQAGISGSTIIGKLVRIAGQAGTVGHITIGDGATLGAQSGVNHDVPKGQFVFGYPAQEHREAMRSHASIRRLPHLVEKVRKLEQQVEALQSRLDNKPSTV